MKNECVMKSVLDVKEPIDEDGKDKSSACEVDTSTKDAASIMMDVSKTTDGAMSALIVVPLLLFFKKLSADVRTQVSTQTRFERYCCTRRGRNSRGGRDIDKVVEIEWDIARGGWGMEAV
jgi:hypothetical protein